jgi:hypothetical protein
MPLLGHPRAVILRRLLAQPEDGVVIHQTVSDCHRHRTHAQADEA